MSLLVGHSGTSTKDENVESRPLLDLDRQSTCDYTTFQHSVGHAAIARRGLGQVLSELTADGWLDDADALDLIEPLMRGNARELFPMFERARQLA